MLVGLSLQNAPEIDKGGADAFATPYTMHTGQLTAGVEIQATIYDNLRRQLAIAQTGTCRLPASSSSPPCLPPQRSGSRPAG